MKKDVLDWYSYLAEEFRLPREEYTVNDRAAFECPKCDKIDTVRINHAKSKIKELCAYECSTCRKRDSIRRARIAFANKYGSISPWQLEGVKAKIRTSNERRRKARIK